MKILIGLDDSPYSKAALAFVRRMAWPAGTRLIVASAAQIVTPVYSEAGYAMGGFDQKVGAEDLKAHEELVSVAEQQLKDDGYQAEGRVLQGDPREVLLDIAEEEGADIVVVGSHGRTGLAKVLMGSVASHVVTHAPCSVLVVKRNGTLA